MRLAKVHGEDRLKKACGRALALRAYSYQRVKNILTHKLEAAGSNVPEKGPDICHEHLRGASYYQPVASRDTALADAREGRREGEPEKTASLNDSQSTIAPKDDTQGGDL